jgi:hypothetical protein
VDKKQTNVNSDLHKEHTDPLHTQTSYVSTQAEFMKIEMKGLRKNSSREIAKKADLKQGVTPHHTAHLPQVGKLPSIPDPPLEKVDATTKLTVTVTKSMHNKPATTSASTGPTIGVALSSPSHLQVVPIGPRDSKQGVGRMLTPRSGPHSSGRGRLSQGWSQPQPIELLRGSPIHRNVGAASITEEGSRVKTKPRVSPTASMMLDVNVNEFLTDHLPDH